MRISRPRCQPETPPSTKASKSHIPSRAESGTCASVMAASVTKTVGAIQMRFSLKG